MSYAILETRSCYGPKKISHLLCHDDGERVLRFPDRGAAKQYVADLPEPVLGHAEHERRHTVLSWGSRRFHRAAADTFGGLGNPVAVDVSVKGRS